MTAPRGPGRRRAAALAAALACAALPGGAPATQRGPDGPSWPSAAGGGGLWSVRSADVWPSGTFSVQTTALFYRLEAGTVPGDEVDHDVADGSLQLAAGVADWVELWASARGVRHDAGSPETFPADGRAGLKVRSPVAPPGTSAALLVEASLPFGDRVRGGSTDSIDPAFAALLTAPIPLPGRDVRARVHLNVGYRAHGDEYGRTFEGVPAYYLDPAYPRGDNDRIELRGAIEVRGHGVALFTELVMDRLRNGDVAYAEGPRFFDAGFRMSFPWGMSLMTAARVSLAVDDVSTNRFRFADDLYPDWQLGGALTWARHPASR